MDLKNIKKSLQDGKFRRAVSELMRLIRLILVVMIVMILLFKKYYKKEDKLRQRLVGVLIWFS